MKPILFLVLLAAASQLSAQQKPDPAPGGQPATATSRSRALELAGAFANEGYKLRDGFWTGSLEPDKPVFIEVNLFSGNEYWFSGAALPPALKISVDVYDQKGQPVAGERYQEGPTAAAGLVAQKSGRYFVRIALAQGAKAEFCLVYSYK